MNGMYMLQRLCLWKGVKYGKVQFMSLRMKSVVPALKKKTWNTNLVYLIVQKLSLPYCTKNYFNVQNIQKNNCNTSINFV